MMDLSAYGILLVEDNPNDILFIQRAFQQANLINPLRVVRDGDLAVSYLAGEAEFGDRTQHPIPALILLDLKLPRRSGLEVLAWIRQQPLLRRIPVVMLTSSREGVDVDQAYELGVNSYLLKPVKFEDLIKMIETLDAYWLQLNQYPSVLSV